MSPREKVINVYNRIGDDNMQQTIKEHIGACTEQRERERDRDKVVAKEV
jgi:hypothetical protein